MRYPKLLHALSLFKDLAPSACKVVIDIGVQHRTPFLMQVFPDSFHHLFEPVSLYFEAIESSYSRANIAHQLHGLALSDRGGKIYLHKKSNDGTGRVTHSEVLEQRNPDLENLVEIE